MSQFGPGVWAVGRRGVLGFSRLFALYFNRFCTDICHVTALINDRFDVHSVLFMHVFIFFFMAHFSKVLIHIMIGEA